ncbi:MAG: hypothetical protein PHR47_02355 [Candidatus Pacebacteria bacterium]|nr:hypothetical protein [Candidatus Paceibacterota bacterium]
MKAVQIALIPFFAIIILLTIAHTVMILTSSLAMTLIIGWIFGILIILSIRIFRYVNFDYSGCEKYPRPWASIGKASI